jgi:hypothetical protein
LGLALLVVVALRVIQVSLVGLLAGPDQGIADRLLIWDGGWFINVAVDGYPSGYTYQSGTMVGNGFAFFPLFPMLIRGVALLGVPASDASLFVSGVAGLAAGALIYLLGTALWSPRVGLILTMLVCAQPMAVSLAMGYTEGLFVALVAGTLLAAHQRIWWAAGLLGVCAALTRPTGTAVALALVVAVVLLWLTMRRERASASPSPSASERGKGIFALGRFASAPAGGGAGAGPAAAQQAAAQQAAAQQAAAQQAAAQQAAGSAAAEDAATTGKGGEMAAGDAAAGGARGTKWFADKGPVTRRELWWAVGAASTSLLAGPLFLAWVGWRVGEWDAWFRVQTAGWGSTFDWGESVLLFLYDTMRGGTGMVDMVTAWLIIAAVALCLVAAFDRTWLPLLTFGLVALVLALGQAGYWHSKPRLLVPVLLLACVPLARALAKAPARVASTLLVLWIGFGLWFGAHMITIWPFTI